MKFFKGMSGLTAAFTLVACTSTVGNNTVNDEGGLVNEQLDWPVMEDATLTEGIFPSQDDLNKIAVGMTKRQFYHAIGRPHFKEANGAREWNYIFKFLQEDQSVKTCLYKVLFDKDKVAQNFYWQPADCNAKQRVMPKNFNLSTDALFRFAKGGSDDIRTTGKAALGEIAQKLIAHGHGYHLTIAGHTDYIGSDVTNQRLSEQRAASVKRYLVGLGLDGSRIETYGVGENEPIVTCDGENGQALIDCLAPNRRVTITVLQ